MTQSRNEYVDTIYDATARPFTSYPEKMTQYLFHSYELIAEKKLLEVGCGRGEFAKGFSKMGLEVHAVDQSDYVTKYAPEVRFKPCDLEEYQLPYADGSFEYVYSKSVIEHFYYPEKLMKEIYRVLKPGGQVISMTPSWEENQITFYEDFTHRTPFTPTSLRDLKLITGFKNVRVKKFIQLPIVWKYPFLKAVCKIVALVIPTYFKRYKFVRFSKEIMLIGTATKP